MIDIGGKKRPLAFPINALIELKKDYGVNVLEAFNPNDPEVIRAIGYVGLKYGHKNSTLAEIDFSIEDVGNWMTIPKIKEISSELISQSKSENSTGEEKPSGE